MRRKRTMETAGAPSWSRDITAEPIEDEAMLDALLDLSVPGDPEDDAHDAPLMEMAELLEDQVGMTEDDDEW